MFVHSLRCSLSSSQHTFLLLTVSPWGAAHCHCLLCSWNLLCYNMAHSFLLTWLFLSLWITRSICHLSVKPLHRDNDSSDNMTYKKNNSYFSFSINWWNRSQIKWKLKHQAAMNGPSQSIRVGPAAVGVSRLPGPIGWLLCMHLLTVRISDCAGRG